MEAQSTEVPTATGRPSEWATPMIIAGNGKQTTAYASFVSATHISSKTREEVFVVTCAPSQCDGMEVHKQTVTQRIEMYVCPGDSDYCPEQSDAEETASPTTRFGYPLGWKGDATVDGTTTEWELSLSILKDNERSSGATQDDSMTWIATTRVGDDIKATTSQVEGVMESGCLLYDNYAFVSVTSGVQELLKDYPDDMFPVEPLPAKAFIDGIQSQRSVCAKLTTGLSDGASKTTGEDASGPENTSSSAGDDDDNGVRKTSLSFLLMGAFLAVSVLIPSV